MDDRLKVALWTAFVRGFRVTVGLVIGATAAFFTDQPAFLGLAPVISAVGKYLREKYKVDWFPV